jgi:hypothetical protein
MTRAMRLLVARSAPWSPSSLGVWPRRAHAYDGTAQNTTERVVNVSAASRETAGRTLQVSDVEGWRRAPSRAGVAPQTVGALDDASRAALRTADNVDDFTVPLKHQPWVSGNRGRTIATSPTEKIAEGEYSASTK